MEFISILLLISFFWNTMHQIFIPAVTVRSWFKKDYFTIATFKLKVVVIHLRITVMAFFYAIFMQHMPCFCKQKKHGFGWCFFYYILFKLFCILEKNMLFVKSVFDFFFILRQNLFAAKLT